MPPKKNHRKKEKPPLSVQGLLHLEASFVAPKDADVTLATVTPGATYGYGDGAGHVPETAEPMAPSGPAGDGNGPAPTAEPTADSAAEPAAVPVDIRSETERYYRELGSTPPAPADLDDPDQYEPPEFADSRPTGAAPTGGTVQDTGASREGALQGSRTCKSAQNAGRPCEMQQEMNPPSAAGWQAGGTADAEKGAGPTATGPAVIPTDCPRKEGEKRTDASITPAAVDASSSPSSLANGAAEHGLGDPAESAAAVCGPSASSEAPPSAASASPAEALPEASPAAPAASLSPAAAPLSGGTSAAGDAPAGVAGPAELLSEQWAGPPDGLLEHYWQFVRENPYDFNGWTYLLQHVEKQTNLDAIRGVYNAFLPLYPYCYAYWKKYADLEQRSGYTDRALQILERGVKAVPLSIELWMALLNQFRDSVKGQKTAQEQTRELGERAVRAAGAQFRSDALWESFIQWESTNGALSRVTDIYRRLLKVPTRLYNRHWDNFLQHVRDTHPGDVLERDEYLAVRRECCTALDMPYREEPPCEPGELVKTFLDHRQTQKAETKLISAIKEKLVASMVGVHEETERNAEKRWKLEEKIKRPYFHVIPLDRRQLRAWRDYLELEAADGDHDSLVLLYERCLIACAQYEEFWMQYARYLERRLEAAPPAAEAGSADEAAVGRLLSTAGAAAPFETESRRLPEERPGVGAGFAPRDDPVDAVREVYKRACLVHCPTRPNVRLQWAAFEESSGNVATAVQLIGMVVNSFPTAVRPRLQLIGLERRRQRLEECSRLYQEAAAAAPEHLRTWWAMKHARFCFKILKKPDKALGILRTAVKRDRSNARLYLHILDVCYQRHPVDVRGVTAALTLALNSKELSAHDKLGFRRKRVEFFEEFGTLRQLRDAEEELETAERELAAAERKQARHQEQEQEQGQEPADGGGGGGDGLPGVKRRRKVKMDPTPPPPVPVQNGDAPPPDAAVPSQPCPKCGWSGAETPAAAAAATVQGQSQPPAAQPVSYGQVPPTWDLTMKTQTCGYGKDPQYKWFQERGYQEYSAREAGGYPASLLDPVSSDEESLGPAPPPAKRPRPDAQAQIVTRDGRRVPRYVIPPQAPALRRPSQAAARQLVQQPTEAPGRQEPQRPPQLARLPPPPPQETDAPCVNVPEWLVREGGELCLSETEHGVSLIRYWPHFMTDKGVQRMFNTLRRYVKWHMTRQVAPDGRFVALKRLVAWFGPCSLEECGLLMPASDSWSPELLDLLQRLIQFTGQELNSCHLSLFRNGHDLEPWHAHDQPSLGRQPSIAVVSLGAIRSFELRQNVGGGARFLRFPLFPGSLLVMEGSTQQDWVHQIPKDPRVTEERIGLQFRVMYDLRDIQTQSIPRL